MTLKLKSIVSGMNECVLHNRYFPIGIFRRISWIQHKIIIHSSAKGFCDIIVVCLYLTKIVKVMSLDLFQNNGLF